MRSLRQRRTRRQSVTVRGDPRLLRRMIRNLLENAKRHGAPPIEVSVSLTRKAWSLRLRRRAGIPESERERVFEPFHRAAAGEARGSGSLSCGRSRGGMGRGAHPGSCFIVACRSNASRRALRAVTAQAR